MKSFLKKFFDSFIWLMALIFVIDIVTKWCVFNYFKNLLGIDGITAGCGVYFSNTIPALPGFLHIGCTLNKGAAWSLGTTDSYDGVNPLLIVISVVLSAAFIFYYVKEYKKLRTPIKIALALMIAGAVGNMIDRIFYSPEYLHAYEGQPGGVVDFIDFFKGSALYNVWHFIFNIADCGVVIGVFMLIISIIIEDIQESRKEKKAAGPVDNTKVLSASEKLKLEEQEKNRVE